MKRMLAIATLAASLAAMPSLAETLSAVQIADRNAAARGGLDAWQSVNSLQISGKMDAGGKEETLLPYSMTMKRPGKSRLELRFQDQTAVQVYDGAQGWKWRPFLNRKDIEPFTAAEKKSTASSSDLDGPLIDYARKGSRLELDGTEKIEGSPAYKLKLTLKDGTVRRVWVDAKTFLDVKIEGEPRRMNGKVHSVSIYNRDFRKEGRIVMPHLMETAVDGVAEKHKMTIDKVVVNGPVDDLAFSKAQVIVSAR